MSPLDKTFKSTVQVTSFIELPNKNHVTGACYTVEVKVFGNITVVIFKIQPSIVADVFKQGKSVLVYFKLNTRMFENKRLISKTIEHCHT